MELFWELFWGIGKWILLIYIVIKALDNLGKRLPHDDSYW